MNKHDKVIARIVGLCALVMCFFSAFFTGYDVFLKHYKDLPTDIVQTVMDALIAFFLLVVKD